MNDSNLTQENLKKEYEARLREIESQLAYLRMLRKNYEQDIIENKAEKELILRDLKRIRQEENLASDNDNGQELNRRWSKITQKLNDANTYQWQLFRNNTESTVLTPEIKEDINQLVRELTQAHNNLSKIIKAYELLFEKYNNEPDSERKEKLQKDLDTKVKEFTNYEEDFNRSYLALVNKQQTREFYEAYAQDDVEKKLEDIDIGKTEQIKLASSRENVDRAKMFIYIEDYLRAYGEGREIPVPEFVGLKKYYNSSGEVKNQDFPQFFKELTGINLNVFNQENSIKVDKVRQILSKQQISTLSDKEKLALKSELIEEDLSKEEVKKPFISYLSLTEKEEDDLNKTRVSKLKANAKKLKTDFAYGFDPYLSRNPLYQKRAKEIHEAVYVRMLEKGEIFGGLSDLGKLTEVESLRSDIPDLIKEYAHNKISGAKSAVKEKVKNKIDEKILGEGISAKGLRITTSIVDKARYLKRKKRKAKGLGKTLTRFIIKRIFDGIVGKIADTIKSGIDLVKNTTAASRMSNYFRGTSIGQSLQKFGTATLETTKSVAKMPGEFVRGLIDKGDLAVKAIKANRFVIGAMDAGHIAKTALGKAPKGLLYGAGVSSIALSLGIPVTGLLPIAIGGGLLGIGIETIDDLMHSPMYRPTSRFLQWIQSKGSALYRNPITGGFSNEIIQNNPQIAANLKRVGNAFGGTGARLFSAAKSGLAGAMIAATIATLLGVNPVAAAAVTFGAITAGKFALRTATGRSVFNGLMSNTYGHLLSRLAILPLQRMMFMVGTTQIMSNLIEDLVKTVKTGDSVGEYYNRNFSFKDKNVIDKFLVINNYLGMYGYFTNYAFLTRFSVGKMMEYIIRGGEITNIIGPSKYTGFNLLRVGWNGLTSITSLSQLLLKIGVVLKASLLPTIALAGSTALGLGIAALLGINIGGLGATVGALAGGLIGMGIGALLTGVSAGLLSPLVIIGNLIGTTVGAWLGSLFDNSIDKIARNLFAVIGGISFIFTLIDMFNSKSMNLRKITMASMSFALTLPALGGVLDKASVQQSQANSTLPTPTVVNAYYENNQLNKKIQVINNSGHPIITSEINKLTNQIYSQTPDFVNMEKYVVLINEGESTIYFNDNSLIINLSVLEENPAKALDNLLAQLNPTNKERTSLR